MDKERSHLKQEIPNHGRDYLGENKGEASDWVDISLSLPNDYDENEEYKHVRKFIEAYTDIQLLRKNGNLNKAKDKQRDVENWEGYLDFEILNQKLFAAIDVAIVGETNRVDDLMEPVEPSFNKINIPKKFKS